MRRRRLEEGSICIGHPGAKKTQSWPPWPMTDLAMTNEVVNLRLVSDTSPPSTSEEAPLGQTASGRSLPRTHRLPFTSSFLAWKDPTHSLTLNSKTAQVLPERKQKDKSEKSCQTSPALLGSTRRRSFLTSARRRSTFSGAESSSTRCNGPVAGGSV